MRLLQKQEGKISVIHSDVNVCSEHSVEKSEHFYNEFLLDQPGVS